MTDQLSAHDGLQLAPAFAIGSRSKQIIKDVAAEHRLRPSEVTSSDRCVPYVAARRQAILRMHLAGMTAGRIALALNLHRTTVSFHLNPGLRERKLKTSRIWRAARAARVMA